MSGYILVVCLLQHQLRTILDPTGAPRDLMAFKLLCKNTSNFSPKRGALPSFFTGIASALTNSLALANLHVSFILYPLSYDFIQSLTVLSFKLLPLKCPHALEILYPLSFILRFHPISNCTFFQTLAFEMSACTCYTMFAGIPAYGNFNFRANLLIRTSTVSVSVFYVCKLFFNLLADTPDGVNRDLPGSGTLVLFRK